MKQLIFDIRKKKEKDINLTLNNTTNKNRPNYDKTKIIFINLSVCESNWIEFC